MYTFGTAHLVKPCEYLSAAEFNCSQSRDQYSTWLLVTSPKKRGLGKTPSPHGKTPKTHNSCAVMVRNALLVPYDRLWYIVVA